MAREETAALLRRVPLFAELSEQEAAHIAAVAVSRRFEAGTRIFQEGDSGDSCYVVRSGRVRVTRQHTDGRAITLANFHPGDFFGELAMLDGEVRSASVEALDDCELLALPGGDLRGLLSRQPEITVKLVVALTRKLREANERISRQSFQTVPSRVAGVLLALVSPNGEPPRSGATVKMTQADLAQLAGTSRESVSRFLAQLERSGVLQVGRGRVTMVEPERLHHYVY